MGSDAVAGGAGDDWATCLSLLECAAAADVARDGAASTVASSTRVGGRCLFVPGSELNEIKKIKKKPLCLIWPPTGNSNTTTNQKHTHVTQAVNVRRFDRRGARGERDSIVGGDQVGRGGIILK